MPFRNDRQRRAAFANMSAMDLKQLKTKSSHYIEDERIAVDEYNQFKKEINDAGLPERLVDKVGAAAKDEHRHMNDMIEVKGALDKFKENKPKQTKVDITDTYWGGVQTVGELKKIYEEGGKNTGYSFDDWKDMYASRYGVKIVQDKSISPTKKISTVRSVKRGN